DLSALAIEKARGKAAERGLTARFEVADALHLERLGETFDTVIDSGLFHVFADADRPSYVASLAAVLEPGGSCYLMCFSDSQPGRAGGDPARVRRRLASREHHAGHLRAQPHSGCRGGHGLAGRHPPPLTLAASPRPFTARHPLPLPAVVHLGPDAPVVDVLDAPQLPAGQRRQRRRARALPRLLPVPRA